MDYKFTLKTENINFLTSLLQIVLQDLKKSFEGSYWNSTTVTTLIHKFLKYLLVHAMIAEYLNWPLCFISAWIVGKVLAPAKANIMLAKALTHPSKVGNGYCTSFASGLSNVDVVYSLWSSRDWIKIKTHAVTVVSKAPTAIGLEIKSNLWLEISNRPSQGLVLYSYAFNKPIVCPFMK